MDYKVVAASSIKILEEMVNELIGQGYAPAGGMTIEQYGSTPNRYCQSMYKTADTKRRTKNEDSKN